jgi:hypothetical protein
MQERRWGMKPEDKAKVQQALEALEVVWREHKAIDGLRQLLEQPADHADELTKILNNPEEYYPGNFDTPQRANALLTGLCQDAATEIERLNKALKEKNGAQPADHGDELTIAYLDGVHTGKKMAKRDAEQEASPGGVLFAVEEAIRNGDCPFAIEIAFDAYEAERKALAGITQKKGTP